MTDEALAGQRVLVTGGSGFIGSHLCRRLIAQGCDVHATSRRESHTPESELVWWQSDMADLAATRHLIAKIKPDIIFHLAGAVGAAPAVDLVLPTFHSLLTSTVNLLMAVHEAGCRRIILTGSLTEPVPGPEPVPQSPYAAAKWASAAYGRMFHSLFQAPVVILRPFMVYGPAQAPNKLIPSVALSLLREEAPQISSGAKKADWVYIDDVVEGFVSAAVTPIIEGATIDLGSGQLISIRSIVERLVGIVGCSAKPEFGALPDRPGENEIAANAAVAAAKLSWRARTSLDEGLRRTVTWYRSKTTS